MCRGHSFFTTNEELLDRYAECPGSAEVIAVQTAYLDSLHAAPRSVPGAGVLRSCHPISASRPITVHIAGYAAAAGAALVTLCRLCCGSILCLCLAVTASSIPHVALTWPNDSCLQLRHHAKGLS